MTGRGALGIRGGGVVRLAPALALTLALAAGCAPGGAGDAPADEGAPEASARPDRPTLSLPASFTGVLPCGSCPGIRTTLLLREDGRYLLESVYRDVPGDSVFHDVGLLELEPREGGMDLVLRGGREAPGRFALLADTAVRMLDVRGEAIESDLPYTLSRTDTVVGMSHPLRLLGTYTWYADAARLRVCLLDRDLPVVPSEAALELERAYLAAELEPRAPLLVEVVARLAPAPGMEPGTVVESVHVEALRRVLGGRTCPEAPARQIPRDSALPSPSPE